MIQELATKPPQSNTEDLVRGLIKHVGLDQAGLLVQQLRYGEYFSQPPEDAEERERWLHERYAHDIYGHLVTADIFTFFQNNLHNVQEAQNYALHLLAEDEDSNRLEQIDKAVHIAQVLSALGLRLLSDREPTYGVEDCIRRIRERVAALPYVEEYGDAVLQSDLFRGRMVALWSEVEILLRLLLIFYAGYFSMRDGMISEAFARAIQQKSLGPLMQSIQEVDCCFAEGETTWQHKKRRRKLQEQEQKLQTHLTNYEQENYEQRERISHAIRQIEEALSKVTAEYKEITARMYTRDQSSRLQLDSEHKRLAESLEALEHQRSKHRSEEDRLLRDKHLETSSTNDAIAAIKAQFDLETRKRQAAAVKLQARCQRLLGRSTPFKGLNLNELRTLVTPYRNHPAHSVREQLMKPDAVPKAQEAGERILSILSDWLAKGLCPRTAQVVGRWYDMYGRSVMLLAVDDPSDSPKPVWSSDRLVWMYEWKTRPWSDNEVCLVAAKPGQFVFEPIIFSWSDIRSQLMPLLDQGNVDQEEA